MGKNNPAAQGNGETAAAFGTGTGEYKILAAQSIFMAFNRTHGNIPKYTRTDAAIVFDGCRVRVFFVAVLPCLAVLAYLAIRPVLMGGTGTL